MEKIILGIIVAFCSGASVAQGINDSDLEGSWLIVDMGGMDVSDMNDVWRFQNGEWTAISSGHAMSPDPYQFDGSAVDFGHAKIEIIEISDDRMKAKFGGFEYILNRN